MKLKKQIAFILLALNLLMPVSCSKQNKTSRLAKGMEISGNEIDNEYHNYLAGGNLVRIGDSLFYNYESFTSDSLGKTEYDIVEISKDSVKTIYDVVRYFNYVTLIEPIRNFKNHLITFTDSDEKSIRSYDVLTEKWENDTFVFSEVTSDYYNINDNEVVYRYEECDDTGTITYNLIYFNGENDILVSNNARYFDIEGENIYFYEMKYGPQEGVVKKYNISTGETTVISDLFNTDFYAFFVEDSCAIIMTAKRQYSEEIMVCKLDLTEQNKPYEIIKDGSNNIVHNCNLYDDKVYIASSYGVECIDLSTNETVFLTYEYATQCYIVDDTWVYFVGKDSTLWRIPQSGGKAEKVYG